jgi:hypothetical protein
VLAEKEVNFFNSGPVIFRFRFASDNTSNNFEGWAIDDFCFEEIPGPCTVGIDETGDNGMALSQNYPNPFNGASTVDFIIPEAGYVKVSISNVLGQEVAAPVDGFRSSGKHTFEVNSSVLKQGIYYYTLEFAGKKITRKMVVIE